MSSRAVYNKIKRYTDDKIVLSLAKKWLNQNKFFKIIYDIFGIRVDRSFDIEVIKRYTKHDKLETVFTLSTGKGIFKKEYVIRLI